jgi:hypothetical protein
MSVRPREHEFTALDRFARALEVSGTERLSTFDKVRTRLIKQQIMHRSGYGTVLASAGTDLRPVVRQDFLSAFNYTLDYRRNVLTWNAETSARPHESRVIRVR